MNYDPSAPIKSLIDYITAEFGDAAYSVSQGMAETIGPLMSACFGIYVLLIAVNYMRGAASSPIRDIFLRVVAFSVV
ncbi:MAG: hypothetical protein LBI31_02700 [Zoogloeaceae bacterium]|jgi:type IV secretion system protein VirB6|nr:hypothetical protein [Zoogloeaceae bacterium]